MKFGITANPNILHARSAAKEILSRIGTAHPVVLETDLAAAFGKRGKELGAMDVDVVLAIGGDGTVLRALQRTTVKVLGINSGSLGFLTEITTDGFPDALTRLAKKQFTVEERVKVSVRVDGKRLYNCTNEAVLHTAQIAKIRDFEVWLNGTLAQKVRADGIIVATPTGSTSYNLSVGGPIVDPRVEALVISAIAPFKVAARPIVVPTDADVRVKVAKPKGCLLVLDGQHEVALAGTEDVRFTGSKERAKLVKFKEDFYQRIEQKLVGQR
ncbi:MAG TPA: NAD(+)/NADH kinase [Thermoplasmata archaeon]|nr:NAD(+)/NADH kinase [Thermoplasmata archaeon]